VKLATLFAKPMVSVAALCTCRGDVGQARDVVFTTGCCCCRLMAPLRMPQPHQRVGGPQLNACLRWNGAQSRCKSRSTHVR
jgi:hypothetical protein